MLNAPGLPGPMAVVEGSGKIQQRLVSQSYRNPLTCAICNSHQKGDKAFNGRTMRNTGEWTKPLPGSPGRYTHKKGHDGVLRSFKDDTRRKTTTEQSQVTADSLYPFSLLLLLLPKSGCLCSFRQGLP